MTALVVHGTPGSSYTWSTEIALVEKKVPYELAAVPFGAHRVSPHLDRHPFAKVPVIEHDGFTLYETQAILRYIDQVFPGEPLQPSDPREAARMNQILGIFDAYFRPAVAPGILFNRLFPDALRGGPPDEKAVQAAIPVARTSLAQLDRLLGDRAFLASERFTLADIMVAPLVHYLLLTPEAALLEPHPRLRAWHERVMSRESVRTTDKKPFRAS
ncbi:glutathione S-transferase family protein (plasmid) [Sorangium sp. So ce119]|uniref:glutathione S-transferase family protein n=1 Tax=Sorangium sp. So ce119 TaxID=3133279 RepID=UPI003F61FF37